MSEADLAEMRVKNRRYFQPAVELPQQPMARRYLSLTWRAALALGFAVGVIVTASAMVAVMEITACG